MNPVQPCIFHSIQTGHANEFAAPVVAALHAVPDPRIVEPKRSFYWSTKPDRDLAVCRNPTPIPTAIGPVEKEAICRHFAGAYRSKPSKAFFNIVKSQEAIQSYFGGEGLLKVERDLEAFICDPGTQHCMVGNEGFGLWLADMATAMRSQNISIVSAILDTPHHMMALRMQWKTDTDGAQRICVSIYDPNYTINHKRIQAASADGLKRCTLVQCLDDAALHSLDKKGETLWVTAMYPDVKLAQADGAQYLAGIDFGELNCMQALCEAVEFGLGPAVSFLGEQFLKLPQGSDEILDGELRKSRLKLADLSLGVFTAMVCNRPGAMRVFGEFLKRLELSTDVVVPIVQGRNEEMQLRGLAEAMYLGHHQCIIGYGHLVKAVNLGASNTVELLTGRDQKSGLTALQISVKRDDAARVLVYGRMLEDVGLNENSKARLLTMRTEQGEATVQVALRSRSPSALRAYVAILVQHLPPQIAFGAMEARDERGVPVLFDSYRKHDIGAIETFAFALVNSGFSRAQALQLFDAEVPQDQRNALGALSGYSLAQQGASQLRKACAELREALQQNIPEVGRRRLTATAQTAPAVQDCGDGLASAQTRAARLSHA